MKTLAYTDSRHTPRGELVFVHPRKPATLLRRFRRYIETSDWDRSMIRKQPVIDMICWAVVTLSGLAISPFMIAALLK